MATGSIKAHEAASPAVTINANGWTLIAAAKEAIIGYIIVAAAVFEATSDKRMMNTVITAINITKLIPFITVNCLPIHAAKPVSVNPFAIAKPPPNNKRTPHGTFAVSLQLSNIPSSVFWKVVETIGHLRLKRSLYHQFRDSFSAR